MTRRTAIICDIAAEIWRLGICNRVDAAALEGEAEGAAEVELGAGELEAGLGADMT